MNFLKRFWFEDEILVGMYFMTRAQIASRLARWILGYGPMIALLILIIWWVL